MCADIIGHNWAAWKFCVWFVFSIQKEVKKVANFSKNHFHNIFPYYVNSWDWSVARNGTILLSFAIPFTINTWAVSLRVRACLLGTLLGRFSKFGCPVNWNTSFSWLPKWLIVCGEWMREICHGTVFFAHTCTHLCCYFVFFLGGFLNYCWHKYHAQPCTVFAQTTYRICSLFTLCWLMCVSAVVRVRLAQLYIISKFRWNDLPMMFIMKLEWFARMHEWWNGILDTRTQFIISIIWVF